MVEALFRELGAVVVVDLGFGDAGKGRVVDSLVRTTGARRILRFNGGAQAGHTVRHRDGRVHVFSQVGATFTPGVRTLLGGDVRVDFGALGIEAQRLSALGLADVLDRVDVDGRCAVVTPFHVALNRLREHHRGENRHGSCGAGVGACAEEVAAGDPVLRVAHLSDRREALRRSAEAQARARERASGLDGLATERALLDDPTVPSRWLARVAPIAAAVRTLDADAVQAAVAEPLIAEGAQGVLLDEHAGFRPHVTWSVCTPDAAMRTLGRPAAVLGVLRTYLVRHGAGPLPTEDPALDALPEPDNHPGPWQGRVRRGWPDLALLRYARDACARVGAPVDRLAVTHLDTAATRAWRVAPDRPLPPAGGAWSDAPGMRGAETTPTSVEGLLAAFGALVPVGWSSAGPLS